MAYNPQNANGQATSANSQPMVIASDQSSIPVKTNAVRNGGVLHRSAITAVDKLALGGTVSVSAVTEAGSNLTNNTTYFTACPVNRWGPSGASSIVSVVPTANQAVRLTIPQTAGADSYDIFCGHASPPSWVGRITETQRAAGGYIISTVGTVSAGGGAGAGAVEVGIIGTGLVSNVPPFASNNAYTPATPTPINCAGYSRARILVKVTVTDFRSLPAVVLVPFFANQVSNTDWHQGQAMTLPLFNNTGQSSCWDISLDVDGSTDLVILVDSISGQGTAVSAWVELM